MGALLTHDELIQRAQALVDGSITLNEFKAWFSYHHKPEAAEPPAVIPGEALTHALATTSSAPEPNDDPRPLKDKSNDIKNALQLSGFKAIQIQRADYGFAYEITATYNGNPVRRTITRPDIHLVVDLMREDAE